MAFTPRRWLLACNPRLSELITSKIGHGWERDLDKTARSGALCRRRAVPERLHGGEARQQGPSRPADQELHRRLRESGGAVRCAVKRLHEYKRQHLNLLHILALYRRLLQNPDLDIAPRVFIFAAKLRRVTTSPSASSRRSTPSGRKSMRIRASTTGSKSSSCPTTGCRWPSASSRRPIFPSRFPPPVRKRRERGT